MNYVSTLLSLLLIIMSSTSLSSAQTAYYQKIENTLYFSDMNKDFLIHDNEQVIRIKEPGLYIFQDFVWAFYLRYLLPGDYTFQSIKDDDSKHFEWPEFYLNTIIEDTVYQVDTKALMKRILPSDLQLSDLQKKLLVSITQDAINSKLYYSKNYNFIQLVKNKEDYIYNYLSRIFVPFTDNFYYHLIGKDIRDIVLLKSRYWDDFLNSTEIRNIHDSVNVLKKKFADRPYFNLKEYHIPYRLDQDFTFVDKEYKQKRLYDLLSPQYTIIYLWGTWCGYCHKLTADILPQIDSLVRHTPGFSLITIASEDNKNLAKWHDYISSKMEGYNNYAAESRMPNRWSGMAMNDFFHYYGIVSFPNFIIIDQDRNIVLRNDAGGQHVIDFITSRQDERAGISAVFIWAGGFVVLLLIVYLWVRRRKRV